MHFHLSDFIAKYVTGREQSLFQRDMQENESELRRRIEGKSVMVIGGAGTIGASFVKAMLPFRPGRVYVADINENGLTELVRDVRSTPGLFVPKAFVTYPVNFSDAVFEKIWQNEWPFEIVANFAAHKHVRSEKDRYSIEAMVENNVFRAKRLLDLLRERPPERFFCVSTDKAANPVNVMGATKKLMEELALAYARYLPVTTARFANVAFSNGSLLAGFLERLMKRQPLSAPSDVQRYFVSPEESGQICLLACILGEPGDIFFPKLESAGMKCFSDIGTALLRELGYEPVMCHSEEEARNWKTNHSDSLSFTEEITAYRLPHTAYSTYPVHYFHSDTDGEKAYEEFYTETEEPDLSRFHALGVIQNAPKKSPEEIEEMLEELKRLFRQETVSKSAIIDVLSGFLPTFGHLGTGRNLDERM